MPDQILTHQANGVLHIRINRPEKKNALTLAMYDALTAAVAAGEADAAVRVLLFSGSNGQFTAGNDLGDFINNPPDGEDSPVFRFLRTLIAAQKPVVAAVQGVAIGIGTTLLLHCDLVYAAPSARFQLPFVNLGLTPEAASSLILPQLMGHRRAAQMLLLGDTLDAAAAQAAGLINAVVTEDELEAVAMQKAQELAAKAPQAVLLSKQLMKRWSADAVRQTMSAEGEVFIQRLHSPEALEAITAFFERRAPRW
ncbi:MAG: enoyl-CoA hydratase [Caldilineales bacterium]